MKALFERLLGQKRGNDTAAQRIGAEEDGYVEVPGVRYFEIVSDLAHGARGAYPARELDVLVRVDDKEAERRLELRVNAFAARHPRGYKPYDVFLQFPSEPIDPAHVVDSGRLKRKVPKILPEFSVFRSAPVVARRVKEAVESLEPGAHSFYPFNITSFDGTEMHEYFFVLFHEKSDCVDHVRSGYERCVSSNNTVYWSRSRHTDQLFLREERIGDRHWFRDESVLDQLVSGQLVERLGDFLPRGKTLKEVRVVRRRDP